MIRRMDDSVCLAYTWDFKDLEGFEIVKSSPGSTVMTDVTFLVWYRIGRELTKKEIKARVIRESAPYTPSVNGRWGVNPTSALREEDRL